MNPQEQIKERYTRYHACFQTGDGKWVLEDFLQQNIYSANEQAKNATDNNPIGIAFQAGQQALLTKLRLYALGECPTFEHAEDQGVFDE